MNTLIIFVTPPDAACVLKTDSGAVIPGHPAVHPTGRQGVGFDIPDGHVNGHGGNLIVTGSGFVPVDQRGTLWLNQHGQPFPWTTGQTAAWVADDFTLQKAGAVLPPLRVSGTAFVQEVSG